MSDLKNTPPPPDHDQVETLHGTPIGEHMNIRADGQQEDYLVLSATERARGFVRPVRYSYKHVGPPGPKFPLRDLTNEEKTRYGGTYVKFESYPEGYKGSAIGRLWNQTDLDRTNKGCGAVTTIDVAVAETYARSPTFYSGTFCARCGAHFPVGPEGEFIWTSGSDERVGT